MKLIDTHCHPQMAAYDGDRAAMIQRTLDNDIGLIAMGTNLLDSVAGVRLAEQYPDKRVYAAIGVHPTDEDLENLSLKHLESLIKGGPSGAGSGYAGKVVGIGETGLDYFKLKDADEQDLQADVFEQHIILSQSSNLPLIVHCRDKGGIYEAYDHVYKLLVRHQAKNFVMHCYSGDWEWAEKFLDLGGMLSFTGIITFPNSAIMQDVVKRTPLDRIMVETDAPFLAPQAHRGERNEPIYVKDVAEKAAAIKGVSVEEIMNITTANACQFFKLPE
jgi:TatD DNase family protein